MKLHHQRADLSTIWLLGDPVAHSLSPLIQNTAIEILGAKALYLAAPVKADNFKQVVRALPKLGAIGANVTVPHKIRAFELCEHLSERAKLMGAVNTLQFRSDGIFGDNTDGIGWWNSLHQDTDVSRFRRAFVIGAGGAARAICHTLCAKGLKSVHIFNRTSEKAELLATELRQAHGSASEVSVFSLDEFAKELVQSTLIVQTTSVGLQGEKSPVSLPSKLPQDVFFSELIYGRSTPLMEAFQQSGAEVQDGLGMLCGQGAQSLALWLDKKPEEIPLKQMIEAARATL